MFNNFPVFVEIGGLIGLSHCLRSDLKGGIRSDEATDGYATRKELYSTNHLPIAPGSFGLATLEGGAC